MIANKRMADLTINFKKEDNYFDKFKNRSGWMLKYGKYKGKTYEEIYETDKFYCAWVRKLPDDEISDDFAKFREYCYYRLLLASN